MYNNYKPTYINQRNSNKNHVNKRLPLLLLNITNHRKQHNKLANKPTKTNTNYTQALLYKRQSKISKSTPHPRNHRTNQPTLMQNAIKDHHGKLHNHHQETQNLNNSHKNTLYANPKPQNNTLQNSQTKTHYNQTQQTTTNLTHKYNPNPSQTANQTTNPMCKPDIHRTWGAVYAFINPTKSSKTNQPKSKPTQPPKATK